MSTHTNENSAVMSAAEFRIARERLNVSREWLADRLGVVLRTLRRWEAGTSPVSDGAALEVLNLLGDTDAYVKAVVSTLRQEGPDPDVGGWRILVFADDATYLAHHPGSDWSASWHRGVMGRVADEVPGVRLLYPPTETS